MRRLALAGLLVAGAALAPMAASAHFEGGSWNYHRGQGLLVLTYDNQCTPSDWANIVDLAAENWTWTPTELVLSKAPNSSCSTFAAQIDVLAGWNDNTNVLAMTSNYEQDCVWFYCWWDQAFEDTYQHSIIRINANQAGGGGFANLDGFSQLEAVAHEMGHSLGLAHAGYYANPAEQPGGPGATYPVGSYSVMDYCCWQSLDHPLPHDINDFNTLYPF